MKTRDGFVSNSSSSSFVVRIPTAYDKRLNIPIKHWATESDIVKLVAYGFKPTCHVHASRVEALCDDAPFSCEIGDAEAYAYKVDCNEDEVITFLRENDIPFHASCHYGHVSVFFARGDKALLCISNLGLSFETYGAGEYENDAAGLAQSIYAPKAAIEKLEAAGVIRFGDY